MRPAFLLAETTIHQNGVGPALPVDAHPSYILVTLGIEQVLEQQSLLLGVYGSADGEAWNQQPLVEFPQKFYCGLSSVLVNLARHPEVRFLRLQWQVDRWGRGDKTPSFRLFVVAEPLTLQESTGD